MAHKEHKLGGVVEAALDHVMVDEEWLSSMATSTTIEQNTSTEVFRALESYIVDELALKVHNQ